MTIRQTDTFGQSETEALQQSLTKTLDDLLQGNRDSLRELKLMNARIEEAFETTIVEADINE